MHTVTITNGAEKTTIHSDNLDRILGGKVVKAINAVDSFTFTIYPDNAGYDKLKPLTTSVTVTDDSTGKNVFIGRVLKCPDSICGIISIDAIFIHARQRRIVLRNAVELLLEQQDFLTGGAYREIIARP